MHKRQYNIKTGHENTECDNVGSIQLVQHRVQFQDFENKVIKLRVPYKERNFFNS
jgi:hypothetical protein